MAFGEILLAGYSRQSQAGKMAPSCPLGQPITACDLVHLARLRSQSYNKELSCPLRTTHCVPRVPQEKFPRKPNNKSFIDQAFSVEMAGYWPHSFFFFSLWTLTLSQSINMQKKELDQYPATMTSCLVNNPYIHLLRLKFYVAKISYTKLTLQAYEKVFGKQFSIYFQLSLFSTVSHQVL